MLKYLLNVICVSLLSTFPSFASCHVSDCDDQNFIELGKQYPSVGCFSYSEGIVGSGTLVDVDIPELYGRVIVTCAHIFIDCEKENIKFTLGDNAPTNGRFYIHPKFEEYYHNYEIPSNTSFDIGLFIIDESLNNFTSASLGFDMPYKDLLESNFVSVGFGCTGHIFGKYEIIDLNKRASYAHAHSHDNPNEDKESILTVIDKNHEKKEVPIVRKYGYVLTLTPYISSKEINQENTLETFRKPAGIAKSGDSGGGCFEIQNGKLIGVISGGSGPALPTEYVLEQDYFLSYREGLTKIIQNAQEEYQQQLITIEHTQPENLEKFQEEVKEPKMPLTIDAGKVMKFINAQHEKEKFYFNINNQILQNADLDITIISCHKDWINDILNKYLST